MIVLTDSDVHLFCFKMLITPVHKWVKQVVLWFVLATKERRLVTQLGVHVGTQFVSVAWINLLIINN